MKDNNMPALLGAVAALLAAPASAALFRCGNVFQDRPCDTAVQQEAAGSVRPASASPAAASAPRAAQQQPAASAPHAVQPQAAASSAHAQAAASSPASAQPSAAGDPRQAPAATRASASAPGSVVARTGPENRACPGLRDQRDAIDARLRDGGSPRTVDMYQRQRREIEQYLAEANCP